MTEDIPAGLCQCGCGATTKLAPRTDRASGWVKGVPLRFIRNHHHRKPVPVPIFSENGTALLPLSGSRGEGKSVMVDAVDLGLVAAYRWTLSPEGYVVYSPDNRTKVYLHKLIVAGSPEADHVNGDKLDCRRENLRPATHRQNARNRRRVSTKRSSRYLGVYGRKKVTQRWYASLKGRHLGVFDIEEEAATAYDRAAFAEYGEFARLNFPDRLTPEGRE